MTQIYRKPNMLIGLIAIVIVLAIVGTTVMANASSSNQVSLPSGALILERTLDPVTGAVITTKLVYQDSSTGEYLYAETNETVIVLERSATQVEIQQYISHQVVSTPPTGENSIFTWRDNRIAAIQDCEVFIGDYIVASQSQQAASQAELGVCIDLLLSTDRQVINNLIDVLVVNGIIEP